MFVSENTPVYAAAVSNLVGSLGVVVLSYFEHRRSIRPSDILVLYLLATILVDSLHLWFGLAYPASNGSVDRLITQRLMLNILFRGVQLFVESSRKDALLVGTRSRLAPEETAGILQRTFFSWVNSVLKRGASGLLQDDDFRVTDSQLSTRKLRGFVIKSWKARGKVFIC